MKGEALTLPAQISHYEAVAVPFRDGTVLAVDVDGKPHVILKAAFEAIGLDADQQVRKTQRQHWARTLNLTVRAGDGKPREMVTADLRTFLMALATIPVSRVAEAVQQNLMDYQNEVADVIEAYWNQGGAINPRATGDQLATIIGRAEGQARVLRTLNGIVDPIWLEAKARHVAARALGEEPEIDPTTRPLTVGEYLEDKGITGAALRSLSPRFGAKMKKLYRARYNADPGTSDRFVDGALRPVAVYTEGHRPMFDEVFSSLVGAA